MSVARTYRTFVHKDARLRICTDRFDDAITTLVEQRRILEDYLLRDPGFGTSLVPVDAADDAPEVVRRMARAGRLAGTGPMAAVAGAMAQLAVESAMAAGAAEAIVENGGDICLVARAPVTVGLYAGDTPVRDHLAFAVDATARPLAICSSSGRMGHSLSLGQCDLATVVAGDAALADAAATQAANLVRDEGDVNTALESILAIPGVAGVMVVKGERVGLAGCLPRLIRNPG